MLKYAILAHSIGNKWYKAKILPHFTTSYSFIFLCLSVTGVWVKYLSDQHATEIVTLHCLIEEPNFIVSD